VSRRRYTIKLAYIAFVLTALFAGSRLQAQTSSDEAQVKAAFVYNFLKFVDWPPDAFRGPQDSFVVGIVGEGDVADATERFLAGKQLGARPIVVRRLRWDQSFAGVHAVFIAERDAKRLHHVFVSAAAASTLSIGEGEDFATHGGVIGLLIDGSKVRFDIDTDAAQVAGLHVSSKLLALTRVIHSSALRAGARP
jgi:hypothetical protein